MNNDSHLRYLPSTFRRESEVVDRTKWGALKIFSAFRADVAATAPRRIYLATPWSVSNRASALTIPCTLGAVFRHIIPLPSPFFSPVHIVARRRALYIYSFVALNAFLRRDTVRATPYCSMCARYAASYYVFTSFFLPAWRSSHVQFIARTRDSLYTRAFCRGTTLGENAATEDREGDLKPYY